MIKNCARCKKPCNVEEIVVNGRVLKIAPICNPCADLEEFQKKQDSLDKRNEMKKFRWSEICPPLFMETDVKRLPQKQVAEVMGWNYQAKGLLLYGATRKGKTRCAWLLLKKLFWDGITFKKFTTAEFSRASSDAAANGYGNEWFDRICRAPVLFIDDFGRGKMTERNESDLFDCFNTRFENKLPVLITTNRGESDPTDALDRRLIEFCSPVLFT